MSPGRETLPGAFPEGEGFMKRKIITIGAAILVFVLALFITLYWDA